MRWGWQEIGGCADAHRRKKKKKSDKAFFFFPSPNLLIDVQARSFGGFNGGILATGAVPGAKWNYAPAPEHLMQKVRQIEAVCARYKVPLPAAALQFLLAHPTVASHVPGTRNVAQLNHNIALMEHPVPAELWADLKREGLLREDAPVPASV